MLRTLLTTTDPANYAQYLKEKTDFVLSLLKKYDLTVPEPEIFASAPEYYRMRAEFAVFFNKDGGFDYIMFEPGTKDPKVRHVINEFPIAAKPINQAMTLLKKLVPEDRELAFKLFEIEFLCARNGTLIIAMDYHKKLDETGWTEAARRLKAQFAKEGLKADFVGRARKQKLLADTDTLKETIHTEGGDFSLFQVEGNFTQPNIGTCQHMVNFARGCARGMQGSDLLELYCGSGTFTVCLADLFDKVLATEVSRVPTQSALRSLKENGITNTKLVRLSAVEVTQALEKVREFRRLKEADIDLSQYNFRTLLIDPPRSGLKDKEALDFTARFERVIYISCGPEALASDLNYLKATHHIEKLAFFDQFPYTPHLESGVLLVRNR